MPPGEIHSKTTEYIPPAGLALRADVRVVEVPVVVRDGFLHSVDGLTKDDFQILDEGVPQTITSFSVEHFDPVRDAKRKNRVLQDAPRPRFLALCFDDVHMLPGDLKYVKDAAEQFVRTGLAPGDRVGIFRTFHSENVQFTSDVRTLVAQIEKITSFHTTVADDVEKCPAHFEPYEAYQVAMHLDPGDAILHRKLAECAACYYRPCQASEIDSAAHFVWEHVRLTTNNMISVLSTLVDGMAKLPGQRTIVLTSGGFLSGSFEPDLSRIMDRARRADVTINELDARGLVANASLISSFDALGALASGTGGIFFHNRNDMDAGFRAVAMAPETSYLLGFRPPESRDRPFHRLKVKLPGKYGFDVEARLGYTPEPTQEAANLSASKLDDEVMASDAVSDLPLTFTSEPSPSQSGVLVVAHLDLTRFRFVPNKDRHMQRLSIVAALLNENGAFLTGKRSQLELDFTDKTMAQFAKSGFTVALTIPAKAGRYTLRTVALDGVEGKIAASTQNVEVR